MSVVIVVVGKRRRLSRPKSSSITQRFGFDQRRIYTPRRIDQSANVGISIAVVISRQIPDLVNSPLRPADDLGYCVFRLADRRRGALVPLGRTLEMSLLLFHPLREAFDGGSGCAGANAVPNVKTVEDVSLVRVPYFCRRRESGQLAAELLGSMIVDRFVRFRPRTVLSHFIRELTCRFSLTGRLTQCRESST
jgi:hypothetical protein